ncbi:glutathione S-transferase family protein [Hyphomonas sp. FCG-A18]|uniref:glutathione S-transferase family protein n=1 Tax=Hyphomonas sp. FCG-A18 TaxID=3080019 RepID=UPI002B27C3E1|nr:glutathione S-transferase family protein [Hyphomonas sp. FCG-A18]
MPVLVYILIGLIGLGLVWFIIEKRRRRTHSVQGGIDRSISLSHCEPIELYSNSFSHCSRKCRLVLAELGLTAKHHSIDLIETGWYQTISPAYLKINPSGLVPTLVHNGHPVFESDDILFYAAELAGPDAPSLIPDSPELQSRMEGWLDFCTISSADAMVGMEAKAGACIPGLTLPMFVSTIQYVPLRNILVGFLFHFDKKRPALFTASKLLGLHRMMALKPIQKMMHQSRDHMRFHLQTLEDALAKSDGDWILGDQFSLADITLSCLLLRLDETGWLSWFEQTSHIKQVTNYYRRLQARPAWTQAISDHAHPIVTRAKIDLSSAVAVDPSLSERIYGATQLSTHPGAEALSW